MDKVGRGLDKNLLHCARHHEIDVRYGLRPQVLFTAAHAAPIAFSKHQVVHSHAAYKRVYLLIELIAVAQPRKHLRITRDVRRGHIFLCCRGLFTRGRAHRLVKLGVFATSVIGINGIIQRKRRRRGVIRATVVYKFAYGAIGIELERRNLFEHVFPLNDFRFVHARRLRPLDKICQKTARNRKIDRCVFGNTVLLARSRKVAGGRKRRIRRRRFIIFEIDELEKLFIERRRLFHERECARL